ncbi:FtsQ-type POTRA domain-containing protein [Candidatus Bipolaricaulota bacterium]|nr:FtsQ-type POTRA domain-containing protein [Candidatus Bipolaricaulota bacterium]
MIRAFRAGCLALVLAVLLVATLRWGGWWRIREVRVPETRYFTTEQLTEILLGANVLRLDIRGVRDVVRRDPRVQEVRIRVRPIWQRVEVDIREREPVAQVRLKQGQAVWVDAEGVILGVAPEAALVGIVPEGPRVRPEAVAAALSIARLDPELRASFPVFDASDPDCVVAKGAGGPTLLLGAIGQLGDKLAILEGLWDMDGLAKYAAVDLRWGDQVILTRRR